MKESSADRLLNFTRVELFISEDGFRRAESNKNKQELQGDIDFYRDIYEAIQDATTIGRRRLRDQYVFNFYDLRKAE